MIVLQRTWVDFISWIMHFHVYEVRSLGFLGKGVNFLNPPHSPLLKISVPLKKIGMFAPEKGPLGIGENR